MTYLEIIKNDARMCSIHINSYLHKVKQMLDFGAQGPLLGKAMHP